MTNFMLLYNGPPTPADATHAGWPEWFQSLGDQLVDRGSPMIAVDAAAHRNGYSIVEAEDRDAVRDLLRTHPLLAAGSEYRIDVYELPAK